MNAHKDFIMPATSPGLHEMELNPISLSFPGDLEEAFLNDYCVNSLKAVRLSLLAGIFLYGFFGILDALLVPELKATLWFIRFAIVWPSLLGVIAFSYSKQFKKYFQPSVATAMIVSGFAIILMIYIIPPPVNYSYYAGLILVLIWGYTFTRVRFLWATTAGWILVALYEIVAIWISNTPFSILMSNNFFFISANLVGMFSCYSIEYYTRRDFFLAFQVENEREKVRAANRRLENIVQERTSQLTLTNKELRSEIEERKRAEEQRKELEGKLEQAQKMKALGTLAGGIAHDFNNLLMGIQGNASLILMDIDSSHPHFEKIKNTEQYVMRGAELTRQLLGFARGGKYEVKSTDLNKLIQKSSEMFGRTKKEITIYTNYQDDIWSVNVDRGQIEQVLLNLFVNAWQAMPGGGNLNILTENVSLDTEQMNEDGIKPGRYVKVSVTDTGIGMDVETQKKIFDPFFTTKEMSRGTGLGLASAYGIIKNHDGFIEVSSEAGKGSTFSLYLPASHDEIVALQEPSYHKALKGTETILLIDDEEMIIHVASGMLQKLGYEVISATSGGKAIDIYKIKKNEIDMVILDMVMPGMSGGKTYDVLKEINPNVKVLLSSGYSMSGEAVKILDRGCDGFIQKPFDIKQISRKIRDILDYNQTAAHIPVQDYQLCIM
ncbi:MAG: response regulator [Deltaproteobacteria bacterium]|nr:response regulator [Deltaproteobacteria bacterium]